MNGPVLAMAPAVEANVPFHRSHSTPDLLSGLTNHQSAASISSSYLDHRTLSLKSLPSLPAFDVPSIDCDFDFDFDDDFRTSLRFGTNGEANKLKPTTNESKSAASVRNTTTTVTPAAVTAKTEKVSRKKSMIDRRRLWLPSSKSSPDVREGATSRDAVPATPKLPNGVSVQERRSTPEPKALERSRTMESLAGLARRSWISSSRSPSPSQKKGAATRQRTGSNGKRAKFETGPVVEPTPVAGSPQESHAPGLDGEGPRSAESSSSTGRALNRASVYLTKFKQRPQSVFVKSSSSLSLSASSSSISKAGGSDNSTAPSAPAATVTTSSLLGVDSAHLTSSNNNNLSSLCHRNSTQTTSSSTSDTTATASENASSQATADTGLTMPHPTSRDPLWATFRKLDADFAVFAAKSTTAAKMGVVRNNLIPFLRNTASHPSNRNRAVLAPEDVDRRATILNKWWNGLLEMLDAGGQSAMAGLRMTGNLAFHTTHTNNLQPVAGVDRPTLLEATTMLMMRPEWRLSTTYFQPLDERSPGERVRARSGTQSTTDENSAWALSRGGSELMVESAEHNVRTMFVTNLTAQMALVVDKMSMRHAPISLVNWSGKACAYAFFFVPGIADVLVRLWGLRPELVRRVADEFGLPRRSKGESEDIVALFPKNLGSLGWTSVKTITDKLRRAAKLPLLATQIHWYGPWVSRWRGGDTDLLFIFCKYYYILAEEFMPSDLPLIEKARAPAFVLLHAQLLANLDSSIQRQGPMEAVLGPPLADTAHGADASMSAISLPPYNLMKGMAENRLVILLKDMLADNTIAVLPSVKLTFAEAFMAISKSATKRTSRYEHISIFMLCDFLEEALAIYNYYQNMLNNSYATSPREESFLTLDSAPTRQIDFVDWPFWFDVCKMMLDSHNTMAEIRVISFIFMAWDAIVSDKARKKALCIDWLLSDVVFDKFFNNWCPMVRAYYMRLLCWRICRDSGSGNDLDDRIFLLVSQRLKTVWSHYLWLKQNAESTGAVPISTAPCYPTPGKRFMIIRTEVQTPQSGLFVGFDQFPTALSSNEGGAYPGLPGGAPGDANNGRAETGYKKKWSLLGKVLSMTTGAAAGISTAGGNPRRLWDDDLEQVRKETAASRSRLSQPCAPPPPPKQAPSTAMTSSAESTSSTGSAPVFDEVQYQFRFTLSWNAAATAGGPPRDRILTRPRLPAPAQARVSARPAAPLPDESGDTATDIPAFRSDSPPPPAPGLPPATRRVSGLMEPGGLVAEARNAKPLVESADAPGTPTRPHRLSLSIRSRAASVNSVGGVEAAVPQPAQPQPLGTHPCASPSSRTASYPAPSGTTTPEPTLRRSIGPTRPTGMYASNATYVGRALAEWSIVVGECNNFVERRREEGVLGLGDVEVPSLGVDGLGLRGLAGRG